MMIDFIQGHIDERNPTYVVIETGGVGYLLHVSLTTYDFVQGKSEAKLFVHEIIREDIHELYGFADKSERSIFRDLISVSGVGANTARLLLSSLSPNNVVAAIVNEDVATIKSVKGLGEKTAQRIIVDLKNKINKGNISTGSNYASENNTNQFEALSALLVLGFDKKKVEKTLQTILNESPNATVDELIKLALKKM